MRLYGKNPVIERLRADPNSVDKIYIEEGTTGTGMVRKKAKQYNIPVISVNSSKMIKMARNKNTQGIMGVIKEFDYQVYEDLLDNALKNRRCPIFLDGITDPQNLGAIIRSVACLGKFAIIIPTHESVSVTETVLRIASGGENYVPIAKVGNINKAIKKAKDLGFWIIGSVVEGGTPLEEAKLPLPNALVVGSEQKGIKDVILKNIDVKVTIPMSVNTLSFNAAHATSILCYEITRQKSVHKKEKSK